MWQKSETENVQKLKTQNVTELKKTQNVTKLKNSKCDKTKKLNMWQNLLNQNMTKLKNSKYGKTQKLKIWQNSKTQNVTNSKCLFKSFLVSTTQHLDYRGDVFEAVFWNVAMFPTWSQQSHNIFRQFQLVVELIGQYRINHKQKQISIFHFQTAKKRH